MSRTEALDGSAMSAGALEMASTGVRPWLIKALVASLAVNLLILTPTLYMLQLYERVLYSMNSLTLLAVSVMTALLLAMMGYADRLRGIWLTDAASTFQQRLQGPLFEAGWRAGLGATGGAGIGWQSELAALRTFIAGPGCSALLDLPWTPIYIAVTWLLHPVLGAAVLCFVVLQVLLAWQGHARSLTSARAVQSAASDEAAFTFRKFRHADTIDALGMAPALRSRWLLRHLAALEVMQQSGALTNRLAAVSKTLRYLQQSAALGIGAWLAVQGEISAGAMIAGTVLATRALAPIDAVVTVWRDVLASRQALARIRSALVPAMTTSLRIEDAGVDEPMTLEAVSAWVPREDRLILRDLELTLRPGEVVAVVGASGAGKSTLMRLLVGVWPNARGMIRRPAARLSQGYLPQDVTLFPGSIAENIARMGIPRSEAVLAAAAAIGLHEQILRLPEGYDTLVGDGGFAVNGGLCQRIGLARALYGNPRLVVLDEPGAHLDEAGERSLLNVLKSLRESGCIVILVTHATGLLRAADRIVTLDRGEIAPIAPSPSPTLSDIRPLPC